MVGLIGSWTSLRNVGDPTVSVLFGTPAIPLPTKDWCGEEGFGRVTVCVSSGTYEPKRSPVSPTLHPQAEGVVRLWSVLWVRSEKGVLRDTHGRPSRVVPSHSWREKFSISPSVSVDTTWERRRTGCLKTCKGFLSWRKNMISSLRHCSPLLREGG